MKRSFEFLANLALVSQIGIMMALPIIGCIWLGGVIDKKLGTNMLFLIILTVLGVGAAFRNLYTLATKNPKRREGNNKSDK